MIVADVRRALAWEDLGFVQDRSTGEWAATRVLSSAPAGRALTWEDLGFVQDRAGRWTNRALRAGHHYNPSQPRDPGGEGGGQWTKGGGSFASKIAGAAKDAEALAAAPVRVVRDDDKRTITLAGVPEPQQRDLLMGVLTYTGGAHSDINAVLRGGDVHGSRPKAEEAIKKVDAAMRHSPLAHDVLGNLPSKGGASSGGGAPYYGPPSTAATGPLSAPWNPIVPGLGDQYA